MHRGGKEIGTDRGPEEARLYRQAA